MDQLNRTEHCTTISVLLHGNCSTVACTETEWKLFYDMYCNYNVPAQWTLW